MITKLLAAITTTLPAGALLLPSCNYKYDMVSFEADGIMTAATPLPEIEIDTNMSAGMMGGSVKSDKPYDIMVHYMDDTFTFASAEFTALTVTYADGTLDPGAAALNLPMSVQGRPHESRNSTSGGVVVANKSRIIRAEFPGTITRDEAFTLLIEGKLTKGNGTVIPFKIKEKYDISRIKRTESWADFVSSC